MKQIFKSLMILSLFVLFACQKEQKEAKTERELLESRPFVVKFVDGTFEEAQAKAKAENKFLLVDVFADWCIPCKQLDLAVFKDEESGKFINEHFVAIKIDGEKGDGPEFVKKMRVQGYPTVIVFDADGYEVDRIMGFNGKKRWMDILRDYTQGINTTAYWREKLEQNPNDEQALIVLAEKMWEKGEIEEAMPYYEKLKSITKNPQLLQVSKLRLGQYQLQNDNPDYLELLIANKDLKEGYLQEAFQNLLNYYGSINKQKTMETFEKALKAFPGDVNVMNNYAWYIYTQKIKDKYEYGIELCQKALKINPLADHIWDTLAHLQYESGNVLEALKAIREAATLNPEEESYQELKTKYEKELGI